MNPNITIRIVYTLVLSLGRIEVDRGRVVHQTALDVRRSSYGFNQRVFGNIIVIAFSRHIVKDRNNTQLTSAFAFGGTFLLLELTDLIARPRLTPDDKVMGLDFSKHSERL